MMRKYGVVLGAGLVVSLAGLTGCGTGMSGSAGTATGAAALVRYSGNVHGGQQAISGATIQLYAVGTAGLKSASSALIASTVTTDANGNFSITGTYSCGSATQVYVVATGGNSGAGANGAISLMAALGPCSGLTTGTFVQVNEVTTVAAVYALAPFMTDYAHVGAAGAGNAGLANAFGTAANLANVTVGLSPGGAVPAGASIPFAEMNTLADILASCVNTSAPATGACGTLFGATGASETIGAALGMARSPGAAAVTGLYTLATPGAPFQPSLTTQPGDFSVVIRYTGNGLSAPYGVAVDAAGSVWATNEGGTTVTKLSGTGAPLGNFSGLLAPRGIAIDRQGNAWVANTGGSDVVKLSAAGAVMGTFTAGGINTPVSLAVDSGSQVWVTNGVGNSVTSLSSVGAATNGSPLTGGGNLTNPAGIAVDSAGGVWVSVTGPGSVAKLTNAGVLQSGAGYTDGSLLYPQGIALDASGNAYVAANLIGGVSGFSNNGTAIGTSPATGGGLSVPVGVSVDGAGTVWVTNGVAAGSLTSVAAGLGAAGSALGVLNTPGALAVDGSGSVWTANAGDNSLSEFVGVAVPVITPLAANVGP